MEKKEGIDWKPYSDENLPSDARANSSAVACERLKETDVGNAKRFAPYRGDIIVATFWLSAT